MLRLFFFAIVLVFAITSCGDGDPDCTMETIVGTYVGNSDCDDTGSSGLDLPDGATTYNVSFISGTSYRVTNQDGDETIISIDGCDITVPELEIEFFGIMIKTSGSGKIDGDQMTLNIDTEIDGLSFSCRAITNKQ